VRNGFFNELKKITYASTWNESKESKNHYKKQKTTLNQIIKD